MKSIEEIEARLGKIHGGRVIDLACGGGDFFGFIENFADYDSLTMLDSSPRAEAAIAENLPELNFKFITGNAADTGLADESFDTVCLSNSLHHLDNPPAALREALRILSPGGIMLINEMHRDTDEPARLSHVMIHHWSAEIDRALGLCHRETYSRDELVQILEGADFSDREIIDYVWPAENPLEPKSVQYYLDVVDRILARGAKLAKYEEFVARSEEIKRHIERHGYAPAPLILMIGRKRKGA